MFKNEHPHVPADFRMSYLASETLQFVKASIIYHPVSLVSMCSAGSQWRWMWERRPDGAFLTIRFRLPSWNDPLPVCDTNVSSSGSNEGKGSQIQIRNMSLHFHHLCLSKTKGWKMEKGVKIWEREGNLFDTKQKYHSRRFRILFFCWIESGGREMCRFGIILLFDILRADPFFLLRPE